MEEVQGLPFFQLPIVCKNWKRVFYIFMNDNKRLKMKYVADGELQDLVCPFVNQTIEEHDQGDYWIRMFQKAKRSLSSSTDKLSLSTQMLTYHEDVDHKSNFVIFNGEIYSFLKDKLKIADLHFPNDYKIIKTITLTKYHKKIDIVMAPMTNDNFTPLPHIFHFISYEKIEVYIYDQDDNSVELLNLLLVELAIREATYRNNFLLFLSMNCFYVYEIIADSHKKSRILKMPDVTSSNPYPLVFTADFFRHGILLLNDAILEFYSLKNGLSKEYSTTLRYPSTLINLKMNIQTSAFLRLIFAGSMLELNCSTKGIFLYSHQKKEIWVLEDVKMNPSLELIATEATYIQYQMFIHKWVDLSVRRLPEKKQKCQLVDKLEILPKCINSNNEDLLPFPLLMSKFDGNFMVFHIEKYNALMFLDVSNKELMLCTFD